MQSESTPETYRRRTNVRWGAGLLALHGLLLAAAMVSASPGASRVLLACSVHVVLAVALLRWPRVCRWVVPVTLLVVGASALVVVFVLRMPWGSALALGALTTLAIAAAEASLLWGTPSYAWVIALLPP